MDRRAVTANWCIIGNVVKKRPDQTWKDFFEDIQNRADRGEIIIGVIKKSGHGHIVAFMPQDPAYPKREEKKVGTEKKVIKPFALEAGSPKDEDKKVRVFGASSEHITRTTNPFIYYRYTK